MAEETLSFDCGTVLLSRALIDSCHNSSSLVASETPENWEFPSIGRRFSVWKNNGFPSSLSSFSTKSFRASLVVFRISAQIKPKAFPSLSASVSLFSLRKFALTQARLDCNNTCKSTLGSLISSTTHTAHKAEATCSGVSVTRCNARRDLLEICPANECKAFACAVIKGNVLKIRSSAFIFSCKHAKMTLLAPNRFAAS